MIENVTLVIRKQAAEIFLTETGVWTAHRPEARAFASFVAALKYAEEHELENVEVICSFGESHPIFALKLPGATARASFDAKT